MDKVKILIKEKYPNPEPFWENNKDWCIKLWKQAQREVIKPDYIGLIIIELESQAEWFDENGSPWSAQCLRERIEELKK